MNKKIKDFVYNMFFLERERKIKRLQKKIDKLLDKDLITIRDYVVFFCMWFSYVVFACAVTIFIIDLLIKICQ